MASNDLHRVANARKAVSGQYQGLLNPAVLRQKFTDEQRLIGRFSAPSSPPATVWPLLHPWQTVADVQKRFAEFEKPYALLERGDAFFSELFAIARHVVRLAEELPKPSADRLTVPPPLGSAS